MIHLATSVCIFCILFQQICNMYIFIYFTPNSFLFPLFALYNSIFEFAFFLLLVAILTLNLTLTGSQSPSLTHELPEPFPTPFISTFLHTHTGAPSSQTTAHFDDRGSPPLHWRCLVCVWGCECVRRLLMLAKGGISSTYAVVLIKVCQGGSWSCILC